MMRFAYFTHSIASCWNNGNAHFLRGVLRELIADGHRVRIFEPAQGWSRTNLLRDRGEAPLVDFAVKFPELAPELYAGVSALDAMLDRALDGADVVIVHEWNDPALVAAIGRRRRHDRFRLLFHDTHHRAASNPTAIEALDLSDYDGILAFGRSLAGIYRRRGWGARAFIWHEAADTRLFQPPGCEGQRRGLVWVGNWGDGERADELGAFLLSPAAAAGMPLDVYGVRYPSRALAAIAATGGQFRGWLANTQVPEVFARHLATVHVPRRHYAQTLPGIPTIRVFEALACGLPLVCAPWADDEEMFHPGRDYLAARSEDEMTRHLRALANDPALRAELRRNGLETIAGKHTCRHRAAELLGIVERLGAAAPIEAA